MNKVLIGLFGLIVVMLVVAMILPKRTYSPATPQEIEMREQKRERLRQVREESKNKEKEKQLDLCVSSDRRFISSKMQEMNRDVVSIQNAGYRKYYVTYISWTTGKGRNGDEIIDYSNRSCD